MSGICNNPASFILKISQNRSHGHVQNSNESTTSQSMASQLFGTFQLIVVLLIVSLDMPFLCSSFGVLSKSVCNLASLACFNKTCYCKTEGLLGVHILCMVSFLPFGECGQCKFHTLPHFLALLYGTVYTIEAFANTVW